MLPIPPPIPSVEQPSNVINILLPGSDQPSTESAGRTDTIIVVSVNPSLPSVALLTGIEDRYKALRAGESPRQEWVARLATLGQPVEAITSN